MFEEFVPFEIANKLKVKGFKEPCFAYYTPSGSGLIFNKTPFRNCIVEDCLYSVNSLPIDCIGSDFIDSPTITQVLKWFRETKGLHIEVRFDSRGFGACINKYEIDTLEPISFNPLLNAGFSKTYEEAALVCIEYVLNNLI